MKTRPTWEEFKKKNLIHPDGTYSLFHEAFHAHDSHMDEQDELIKKFEADNKKLFNRQSKKCMSCGEEAMSSVGLRVMHERDELLDSLEVIGGMILSRDIGKAILNYIKETLAAIRKGEK